MPYIHAPTVFELIVLSQFNSVCFNLGLVQHTLHICVCKNTDNQRINPILSPVEEVCKVNLSKVRRVGCHLCRNSHNTAQVCPGVPPVGATFSTYLHY